MYSCNSLIAIQHVLLNLNTTYKQISPYLYSILRHAPTLGTPVPSTTFAFTTS